MSIPTMTLEQAMEKVWYRQHHVALTLSEAA